MVWNAKTGTNPFTHTLSELPFRGMNLIHHYILNNSGCLLSSTQLHIYYLVVYHSTLYLGNQCLWLLRNFALNSPPLNTVDIHIQAVLISPSDNTLYQYRLILGGI